MSMAMPSITRVCKPLPVAGYPLLADQIGRQPEIGIYRSFLALHAQDILYMQAEIHDLELELHRIQKEDSDSLDQYRSRYKENWWYLENAEGHGYYQQDHPALKQPRILRRLRPLLAQYGETQTIVMLRIPLILEGERIVQFRTLSQFKEPNIKDLANLQAFLDSPQMGSDKLCGHDAFIWGNVDEPHDRAEDLIQAIYRDEEDSFSRWFIEKIVAMFSTHCGRRLLKPDKVNRDVFCKRNTILRITYYITTALASILLILPIAVLEFVSSMRARLAVIAGSNVVVSMCLAVFTMASRLQIFATTAR
jgi:hypothetical protein